MSKGNPILPSEPLSLERNLLAAAVLAESVDGRDHGSENEDEDEDGGRRSPRSTSRARRRMDMRSYGRSESGGSLGGQTDALSPGRAHNHHHHSHNRRGSAYYAGHRDDAHDALLAMPTRDRSPPAGSHRFDDRRERRSLSPRAYNDDRDAQWSRPAAADSPSEGAAAAGSAYYAPDRADDEEPKNDPTPSRVLGIFGMSKFTNESYLRNIFERYGPVDKIQIIRDPYEGRSRGFAFINMRNEEDAQKARNDTTGTMIHDRKVRVDFSFTNRAHSPTPGKYKGQETAGNGGNYHHSHSSSHYGDRASGGRHYGGYRGGGGWRGPGARSSYRASHGAPPPLPPPYRARRRANTRDRRRRDGSYHGHGRDHDHGGYGGGYRQNQHHNHGHSMQSSPPPPPPPPPPESSHRGGGRQWARSKSPGYGYGGGYHNHQHQHQHQHQSSGAPRSAYDSYRGGSAHHDDAVRPGGGGARAYDARRPRSRSRSRSRGRYHQDSALGARDTNGQQQPPHY
ncbi:transformer 2 beta [Coemansia sp. RSA 1939]|nr:transformer 2 beta [Coemansia sp. RSA 1939]